MNEAHKSVDDEEEKALIGGNNRYSGAIFAGEFLIVREGGEKMNIGDGRVCFVR